MKGVPRHLRNPRRAYDADRIEISPATVANAKSNRARGILIFCECGHEGTLPFDGLSDDAIVVDIALRLRCTACGGKDRVTTRPDFTNVHRGAGRKLRSVE